MAIYKITDKNVNTIHNNHPKVKIETKQSTNLEENKEKSNATKYMIGATALAATVAIGIIGHKINWWRSATKNFSKIEGKIRELDGIKYKDELNEQGQIIRSFASKDGKTVSFIHNYNTKTGKLELTSDIHPKTMNKIKDTYYHEDGKTISSITNFDPTTENKLKITFYKKDGKTISSIANFDPTTGNKLKITSYNNDGTTFHVVDFDPTTKNPLKTTLYYEDGISVKNITDYDPTTGKGVKTTSYKPDGSISEVIKP